VAEGVFRSNHPGPARLARYKRMGIRAVLNLRGAEGQSPWLLEEEACAKLGLELRVAKIYARKPATRRELVGLIDAMRAMPKPFVMHCKSGADRAGLAAVLYAHIIDGQPLDQARRHLHWRYVHLASTATGIVDHIVDLYDARNAASPIAMEEWLRTEYEAKDAAISFAELRGKPVPAKYLTARAG
jgi:protein tyrosine/serine phosphatase